MPGGDPSGGAAQPDPSAGGAPDAAMTPQPDQDPQKDANDAETQQKENTDNLKSSIVNKGLL